MYTYFDGCCLPDYIKDDFQILDKLLTNDSYMTGFCLQHASSRLQDDDYIVSKAININPQSFIYASDRLRSNDELFLKACAYDECFQHASESIKKDIPLLIKALDHDMPIYAMRYAHPDVFHNIDLISKIVEKINFLNQNISQLKNVLPTSLRKEIGDNDPLHYLKSLALKNALNDKLDNENIHKNSLKPKI